MANIAQNFRGLPMSELIGGPLLAASDAQVALANNLAKFIHEVGFETDPDNKGQLKARQVNFSFTRPTQTGDGDQATVNYGTETVSLSVPFLALVNTPSLFIRTVDVDFEMEVHDTTTEKTSSDKKVDVKSESKFGFLFARSTVNINGSVASHRENTRTTDTSAKYHVSVHAEDTGPAEGLSRVLDILQSAIAPVQVSPNSSNDSSQPKISTKGSQGASSSSDHQGKTK